MLKKNRLGFTLAETILVLAISTIIVTFIVFLFSVFSQNNIQEKAFWRNFNEQWNSAIQAGKSTGQITTIRFRPKSDSVLFEQRQKNKLYYKKVKLPEGLHPMQYREIIITEKGFVKPQTLNWLSENRHCHIHQRFQLGWGIYYCEDY